MDVQTLWRLGPRTRIVPRSSIRVGGKRRRWRRLTGGALVADKKTLTDDDITRTWMRGGGATAGAHADPDNVDPDGTDADGTDGDSGDSDTKDS